MAHVCNGCSATWTGSLACHCSVCHETFVGITAFDRHRVSYACKLPNKIGLVVGSRGMWTLE